MEWWRRGQDSNLHSLSAGGFQDRCTTIMRPLRILAATNISQAAAQAKWRNFATGRSATGRVCPISSACRLPQLTPIDPIGSDRQAEAYWTHSPRLPLTPSPACATDLPSIHETGTI